MTDKEMIELAGKAIGIRVEGKNWEGAYPTWNVTDPDPCNHRPWNPLTDDGDALRLAVKLRISIIHEQEYMGGPVMETIEATSPERADGSRHCEMMSLNDACDDEMANTRICIVRAAAEIGKQMKDGEE